MQLHLAHVGRTPGRSRRAAETVWTKSQAGQDGHTELNNVGGRMAGNIPGGERGADQRAQIRSGCECGTARDERARHTQSSKSGARGTGKATLREAEQEWREIGGESDDTFEGSGGMGHRRPKHIEWHDTREGGME